MVKTATARIRFCDIKPYDAPVSLDELRGPYDGPIDLPTQCAGRPTGST